MVSGLAPGDRPTDPRRPERVRHVLRFEVGAETLATFREAMRLLQKRSEHRLNDDEALLSMAREVVGGPRDAGRASYQIVVTQCEDCRRGFQHANGELIQLDPAIVEMCHCDAQNVVIAAPSTAAAVDRTTDPVRTASESAKRDAHVCAAGQSVDRDVRAGVRDECAAGGAHVCAAGKSVERDVRAGDEVAASNVKGDAAGQSVQSGVDRGVADQGADCGVFEEGSHDSLESDFDAGGADEVDPSDVHVDAGGLSATRRAGMETARGARTEVSAAGGREGSKRPRAMQDTPPAVRREVFFRDCGRCVVPGCRNATYVDLHHLELRSEGGSE